jgi:post-segregation antitoxin (ccd killing protein)
MYPPTPEGAMPKVSVYLPDDLAKEVRSLEIPLSPVCQRALREEVARMRVMTSIDDEGRLEAAVARLRLTDEDRLTDEQERMEGRAQGRAWALEEATVDELRSLDDREIWGAFEVRLGEERPRPIHLNPMSGAAWDVGFIEAALEVWEKVAPRLDEGGS